MVCLINMISSTRKAALNAFELRWFFNVTEWIPSREEWTMALDCISLAERKRVNEFYFKKDSKLALIGRLLIRGCICECLGLLWQEIELQRTEKGKPILISSNKEHEKFSFNISHQGDVVALATSNNNKVGIDVMDLKRPVNTSLPEYFNLMRRQFCNDEWYYIHSFQEDNKRLKAFYRLWCLKESYIKALGIGLDLNMSNYANFTPITRSLSSKVVTCDTELLLNNEKSTWKFEESIINDPSHIVAVASFPNQENQTSVDNLPPENQRFFQQLKFKDLMKHSVTIGNNINTKDHDDWERFRKKGERVDI